MDSIDLEHSITKKKKDNSNRLEQYMIFIHFRFGLIDLVLHL